MWFYNEQRLSKFLGILRNFSGLKCLTLAHVEIRDRETDDYTASMARAPALIPKAYDPMVLWTLQTIIEHSSRLYKIVEGHDGKSIEHPRVSSREQDDVFLRGWITYGTNWLNG
jgi:hypothetical protein